MSEGELIRLLERDYGWRRVERDRLIKHRLYG
jgi:hypothetical protein